MINAIENEKQASNPTSCFTYPLSRASTYEFCDRLFTSDLYFPICAQDEVPANLSDGYNKPKNYCAS